MLPCCQAIAELFAPDEEGKTTPGMLIAMVYNITTKPVFPNIVFSDCLFIFITRVI